MLRSDAWPDHVFDGSQEPLDPSLEASVQEKKPPSSHLGRSLILFSFAVEDQHSNGPERQPRYKKSQILLTESKPRNQSGMCHHTPPVFSKNSDLTQPKDIIILGLFCQHKNRYPMVPVLYLVF